MLSSRARLFVQLATMKWLILQGVGRSQCTGGQEGNLTLLFHRLVSKLDVDHFPIKLPVLQVPEACFDDLEGSIVSSSSGTQNNSMGSLSSSTQFWQEELEMGTKLETRFKPSSTTALSK